MSNLVYKKKLIHNVEKSLTNSRNDAGNEELFYEIILTCLDQQNVNKIKIILVVCLVLPMSC